jgi:transcriptional regulator with PAS, ATPase and Fis domain
MAARSVAIREGRDAAEASSEKHSAPVLADVPRPSATPARIEATPESVAPFDEWDCQNLRAARYVAALVLEVDDARRRAILSPIASPERTDDPCVLVGSSEGIRAVRDRIARVAATDFTVLVEGESGTGKELVAHQIHEFSRRRRGPFVAVNCAALVESLLEAELFGIEDRTATGVRGRRGKFEHADQGTLFLDEVSDLSMSAQAKLLRAIQEMSVERVGGQGARRVDVRIVVATNRRLLELVERGHFRLDLFYRLNGVEIGVPPLRERREDVIELAQVFLGRHRHVRPLSLSPAARDALLSYAWPGNVRELERVIERAVALAVSDQITLDDLPPALAGDYADSLGTSTACNETMRAWGSRYARLVLERCENNKRRACKTLGISYHTLQAYLRYRPPAAPARGASGKRPGRSAAGTPAGDRPRPGDDREEAVS